METAPMTLARSISLAALVVLSAAACQPLAPQPREPDLAADEAAVRAASAAWDDAHNAGDAVRLAALYAEDAVSMPPNRPAIEGRPAIAADFHSFFAGARAHHRTQIVSLVIARDWAIERGQYRLTTVTKETGVAAEETGKHVVIRRRVDGDWRIHWEIWSADTPAGR
jgi:uncharacterized protein (TIGR02246 family)